ncbi:MAG: alpha/beta hydrolase [Spirosomataceae bacterium]
MKKFLKWTGATIAGLVLIYFVGPRPETTTLDPTLPQVATELVQLEKDIQTAEAKFNLKPDNEARIVWADTSKKEKTKYSIVYIHGFGASWAEGDPIHRRLAQKYGCNLYLARMYDAGVKDPNAFEKLTPQNFLAGAKYALAVGKALGDSVIVIGCSAGGLLSTYLASEYPDIKALVLYSPCFAIYNNALAPATGPWGQQILHQLMDTHINITHYTPDRANYWLTRYHTNGLMTLQKTMDIVVKLETFAKIKMPVFLGYYYKDDDNQDKVVSVEAMLNAFDELATPANQKVKVALPNTGDHVIASHFTSKDLPAVLRETDRFLDEIVGLKATQK